MKKNKKRKQKNQHSQIETHAWNKNPALNTNSKHKHIPKHKAETQAQPETQSRNVENREERLRWVRSVAERGLAAMGLWWLGSCRLMMGMWRKKEGFVEEERRDGETVRRETWRNENEM